MKAPFPWYGGKSSIAEIVWPLFDGCSNYIEPFAGSLAMLLSRPTPTGVELVNDNDHHIINFWRAMRLYPNRFAELLDYPIASAECAARSGRPADRERVMADFEYCDIEAAACWVYLVCALPGNGWKHNIKPNRMAKVLESSGGRGIFNQSASELEALSRRLQSVKIHCGDWKQSLGPGSLLHNGQAAVFLDPPYDGTCGEYTDSSVRTSDVRRWAIEHGHGVCVALCGHESEHGPHMPKDWAVFAWSRFNGPTRHDERVWASPACSKQATLC